MASPKKAKKAAKKSSTKKVSAKKTPAKKVVKRSPPKKIKRVSEQLEAVPSIDNLKAEQPVVVPVVQDNGTVVISPVNPADDGNADLRDLVVVGGDCCNFGNEQ